MRVKSRRLQGSWAFLNHQFKMPYLCTNCGMFLKLTIESWYLRSNLQEKLLCSSKLMVVDKVPKSALKEGQLLAVHWDARTRQNSRHTRVWHGDTRATPLPTHQCCIFFFFGFPTRANSAQTRADLLWIRPIHTDSGRIGLYRQFRPKFKKKKKKKVKKCTVSLSPIHSCLTSQLSSSYSRLSVCLQLHSSTVW